MLSRRCAFGQPQDSEAASDSKHLETLLSGTHGHAEKEHGPALLEGEQSDMVKAEDAIAAACRLRFFDAAAVRHRWR